MALLYVVYIRYIVTKYKYGVWWRRVLSCAKRFWKLFFLSTTAAKANTWSKTKTWLFGWIADVTLLTNHVLFYLAFHVVAADLLLTSMGYRVDAGLYVIVMMGGASADNYIPSAVTLGNKRAIFYALSVGVSF